MRGVFRGNVVPALIAELAQVEAGEEVLPGAQEHGRNGEVHLVDEPRAKVLPDRRHATAEPYVLPIGDLRRSRQHSLDAIGDEMKDRAALHDNRFAGMMRQDKNRHVIGWVVSPPSFPALVGPSSTNRAEHVPAQDPRPDIPKSARRELVVDAGRPALLPKHLPERARGEGPLMQRNAAHAERVVAILTRAGAIAVDRYGEAVDAELGSD